MAELGTLGAIIRTALQGLVGEARLPASAIRDLPPSSVVSVNGQTGAVTLGLEDLGAAALEELAGKADAAAVEAALEGKSPVGHGHGAATESAPGFMAAGDKLKLNGVATGATANSADAALLSRANHTGQQEAATIVDFEDAIDAAWDAPSSGAAVWDDGERVPYALEQREACTCYHILTDTAHGLDDVGIAVDRLQNGPAQALTPAAGIIDHRYPLDPVDSLDLPEVAEIAANRSLNFTASLTDANSAAHEHLLSYPDPSSPILEGLENRALRTTLINADLRQSTTVKLAPFAAGRRRGRWAPGKSDVVLGPGDLLRVRADWFNGEVSVDHDQHAAAWATIALVAGSAGQTAGTQRNIPNVRAGDLIMGGVIRTTGQALPIPGGKDYQYPIRAPFESDGRILLTGRSDRFFWGFAPVDGTFNTGVFTSGSRCWAAAFENVAAVGQVEAVRAEASTNLAFPHLAGPLAPGAFLVGSTAIYGVAEALAPAGAIIDARHDGGPAATSVSLWHLAGQTSHTPAALTVASGNHTSVIAELIPLRSN